MLREGEEGGKEEHSWLTVWHSKPYLQNKHSCSAPRTHAEADPFRHMHGWGIFCPTIQYMAVRVAAHAMPMTIPDRLLCGDILASCNELATFAKQDVIRWT